jgi:hypothetical protein
MIRPELKVDEDQVEWICVTKDAWAEVVNMQKALKEVMDASLTGLEHKKIYDIAMTAYRRTL